MGSPQFIAFVAPSSVQISASITIDVFTSEAVIAPPAVRVSSINSATYVTSIGSQHYRYSYIVKATDDGSMTISGTSASDKQKGSTLIAHAFFITDGGVPFGIEDQGSSPFGVGFSYPDGALLGGVELSALLQEVNFDFTVRRGYEGPQIVTAWSNENAFRIIILRRLYDYAATPNDPDTETVYDDDGSNYADIHVTDGMIYYYSLFVEDSTHPGTFVLAGRGHTLAIDNQGYVDFEESISVLSVTEDVPGSPGSGDRYIVPTGATGAWAGHDGELAVYDGSWSFETPVSRWVVIAADTDYAYTYRLDGWVRFIDKDRLQLYDYLSDYDRDEDKKSAYAALRPQISSVLDGEQFNFDTDKGIGRPTAERVLKLFTLSLGEALGLAENMKYVNEIGTTDINYLTRVGARIGYDDFSGLDNPLRRFLIGNMADVYPHVGKYEKIGLSVKMWLGTGVSYTIREYKDRMLIANETELPVITPTPEPIETVDDFGYFVTALEYAKLRHFRGIGIWLDTPFDPTTFTYLDAVIDAVTAEPGGTPQAGDRYLLLDGVTGPSFAGNDNKIAEFTTVWMFTAPNDRDTVVTADGRTYVYRGTFPVGSWTEAIPESKVEALKWWLSNYVVPGTAYVRLLEYEGEEPPPPAGDVETFELFTAGNLLDGPGDIGTWTTILPFSPPSPYTGLKCTDAFSHGGTKSARTVFENGFSINSGPQFVNFAGVAHPFPTNPTQKVTVWFMIPNTFPGGDVVAGGVWVFPVNVMLFGGGPQILLVSLKLSSPYINMEASAWSPGGPPAVFTVLIPLTYLADNTWHKLYYEFTLDGSSQTLVIDDSPTYTGTGVGLGPFVFTDIGLFTMVDNAGSPSFTTIPNCYLDDLALV